MFVRQTIELRPTNKQKTYFRKCFGARRLAYNYGLREWIRRRDAGEKTNCRDIRTQFNAEKAAGRWPFLYKLSNSATCYAFEDLNRAFDNFFGGHERVKAKEYGEVTNFPKEKSKTYNEGSYTEYFAANRSGGASILDHRVKVKSWRCVTGVFNCVFKPIPNPSPNPKPVYLCLPRIGTVKMTRCLRYEGRPVSVTIRQHNECFYACFLVEITEEEFFRTHPRYVNTPHLAVGIDLGTKDLAVTSDGLAIENPQFYERQLDHENRLQELMNKCRNKGKHNKRPSRRFLKAKIKLWHLRTRIRNQRNDFIHKLSAAVLASYQHIAIETLKIKEMGGSMNTNRGKHTMRKRLRDVSLYQIRHRLQTLGELIGRVVVAAPADFPSTRRCCKCGHVEPSLSLNQRTYICPKCGNTIDRDLNAAINLRNITGRGTSDSMPEVSPMRSELIKSNIKHREIGDGK